MEKYDCGCSITFGKLGEVRSVAVCPKHDDLFAQDKSLKQLSMDIVHRQLSEKHAPPPAPPAPAEEKKDG